MIIPEILLRDIKKTQEKKKRERDVEKVKKRGNNINKLIVVRIL